MNELTRRQKAIYVMTQIYRGFTAEQALAYDKILSDVPEILAEKAIQLLIKTSKFPPTPAEIREAAEYIYRAATGKKQATAEDAWAEILDAISHYGSYGKPKLKNEIAADYVKGKWQELCAASSTGITVLHAGFLKFYENRASERRKDRQVANILADSRTANLIANTAKLKKLNK